MQTPVEGTDAPPKDWDKTNYMHSWKFKELGMVSFKLGGCAFAGSYLCTYTVIR